MRGKKSGVGEGGGGRGEASLPAHDPESIHLSTGSLASPEAASRIDQEGCETREGWGKGGGGQAYPLR